MPIVLSDGSPSDFPTLARLHRKSLLSTLLYNQLFSSVPEEAYITTQILRFEAVTGASIRCARFVTEDEAAQGAEGKIVGFAMCARKVGGEKGKPIPWAEGTDVEAANALMTTREVNEPHYHLSNMVADPDYQRQGIATSLLKEILQKADAANLPIHLNASVDGQPLYAKFGFVPAGDLMIGGRTNDLKVFPMYRPVPSISPPPLLSQRNLTVVQLSTATSEDFPTLGGLHLKALGPSLLHQTLFGGVKEDAYVQSIVDRMEASSGTAVARCARLPQEDGQPGRIVGYSLFARRRDGEKGKAMSWPVGTNLEVAAAFFGQRSNRAPVEGPHYYVTNMITDPEYQRQGIGATLVKDILEKADAERLPTYLTASIEGTGLYEKFGFVPHGDPILGGQNGEIRMMPMCRPVPTQASPRLTLLPLLPDSPLGLAVVNDYAAKFAELHFLSFIPGEMFQSLYSQVKTEDYVERGTRRFQKVVERTYEDRTTLIVAMLGDDVVGGAYWSLPAKQGDSAVGAPTDEKEVSIPVREFPPGTNLALASEYFNLLDTYEANSDLPPHYGLRVLAASPAFPRTGAGSALMNWGIDKADEENVDIRLDSTKEGLGFYPRFGFEVCGDPLEASDKSFALYPMIRRAKNVPAPSS